MVLLYILAKRFVTHVISFVSCNNTGNIITIDILIGPRKKLIALCTWHDVASEWQNGPSTRLPTAWSPGLPLFQVTSLLWETQGRLWFCLFQQNQIYVLHLFPTLRL